MYDKRACVDVYEFRKALEERLNYFLESKTFSELTCCGSFILFEKNMNILGYCGEPPAPALHSTALLTTEQYYDRKYDVATREVFDKYVKPMLAERKAEYERSLAQDNLV